MGTWGPELGHGLDMFVKKAQVGHNSSHECGVVAAPSKTLHLVKSFGKPFSPSVSPWTQGRPDGVSKVLPMSPVDLFC